MIGTRLTTPKEYSSILAKTFQQSAEATAIIAVTRCIRRAADTFSIDTQCESRFTTPLVREVVTPATRGRDAATDGISRCMAHIAEVTLRCNMSLRRFSCGYWIPPR